MTLLYILSLSLERAPISSRKIHHYVLPLMKNSSIPYILTGALRFSVLGKQPAKSTWFGCFRWTWRGQKKKKKKEVSNTSTRTKTGGACVTFQRQDALLLTGTRDEEDQGTRPRLWTPGCWPWRGCAGERSVTFHHRITTSWCPTLAAVYWKRWTCDRKPPASFPTTAAQLHQTQGSTLC